MRVKLVGSKAKIFEYFIDEKCRLIDDVSFEFLGYREEIRLYECNGVYNVVHVAGTSGSAKVATMYTFENYNDAYHKFHELLHFQTKQPAEVMVT